MPGAFALVYLARREWARFGVAILVSAVFLAPMLLYDLSGYQTDPGRSYSLYYYVSPPAWALAAGAASLIAVVLAWRRSPYVWVGAAVAVMLLGAAFACDLRDIPGHRPAGRGRRPHSERGRMIERVARITAMTVAALGILLLLGAALSSNVQPDADAYWHAAQRLRDGQALYGGPRGDETEIYRYAPWFAFAWVPLTYLGQDGAYLVWRGILVLSTLPRCGRCSGARPRPPSRCPSCWVACCSPTCRRPT